MRGFVRAREDRELRTNCVTACTVTVVAFKRDGDDQQRPGDHHCARKSRPATPMTRLNDPVAAAAPVKNSARCADVRQRLDQLDPARKDAANSAISKASRTKEAPARSGRPPNTRAGTGSAARSSAIIPTVSPTSLKGNSSSHTIGYKQQRQQGERQQAPAAAATEKSIIDDPFRRA